MRVTVLGALAFLGLILAGPLEAASSQSNPAPSAKSTPAATPAATAAATPAATAVATSAAASSKAKAESKPVSGTADAPAQPAAKPSVSHRSAAVATTLAWIPGVAIHGAGHIYAGSYMKGIGLFLLEGASVWLVYQGYNEYQRGAYPDLRNNSGLNNNTPATNMGTEDTEVGVGLVALTGFIFTWVDDVAGAGIAADEYNKIQDQNSTVSLHLLPRSDGAVLALSSNF